MKYRIRIECAEKIILWISKHWSTLDGLAENLGEQSSDPKMSKGKP